MGYSGLSGALFGAVQQRVLGLLFGQPARRFRTGEVIALAASGTGAVHRELRKLEGAGLVTITRVGNQKHYQANASSPIYPELHSLVIKTFGLAEPLRRALAPHADRITAAAIFGSVAKGTDSSQSDVDLLVLSDDLSHATLFEALHPVERLLGRSVNPTVLAPEEFRAKALKHDSFVARVAAGPLVPVLGELNDHVTTREPGTDGNAPAGSARFG